MELPQAEQKYLQMEIQYQQLQDELEAHFNLKSMREKLESPLFSHLRHFEHPSVENLEAEKLPSAKERL
jgi:hypothetical protein